MVLFIFILGGDYPCAAPTQAGFLPNDEAGLSTSGGMGKINDTALSGEGYVIYLPVFHYNSEFYYNSDQAVIPSLTTQPANLTVSVGEKATFSVTASGTALTYQWERWNGGTWEKVTAGSEGTTASYTTAPTIAGDNGEQFRCLVTNSGGGAVSDIATLTVNPAAPVITGNPANQAVIEGHSATFTVIAVGTAPLTYQWQRQESLGNPWTNVGTNSSSYTKDPVTGQDHGAGVRCQVRNQAGSVFSDTATLTVPVPPTVTSQPLNQTVSVGQKATFSVIAIGTAPLTYQWLRQEAGGGAWANVGTNSPTYTTDPARAADNGAKFQCLVTNTVGSVLCHEATLIIEYMPDWRGVASGPFDLAPYPFLNQPVLSAANVTDISASFVADPFLFYEKGLWYLFFEALETSSNLGRIGLATSPDGLQWTYRKIVLSEGFHLSYPQVFSYHGQHYMTPEVFQTNSVRLYRATNFPEGWTLVSTLVQGRPFVDPQILRYDNTWWLWVSDTSNSNGYLYYSDNLTGGWTEHPQSPVVRGTNQSRGGGRVFVYHGGTILRLAQDDSVSYGRIVRAFQVDTLTRTTYSEHEIPESPVLSGGSASWNQKGMHQLDPWWTGSEWICAVDGADPVTNWSIGIYKALLPAIPKAAWTLKYVDSQELVGENGAAVNAFDGKANTFWHTKWYGGSPVPPHEIQIDLGQTYTINGFRYLPRQDGGVNGRIGQYEFYVSADGVDWGSPAASGTWANDANEKVVTFAARTGRYIHLRAVREVNGNPWTSMAEINVLGTLSGNQAPNGVIQSPLGDVTIPVGGTVSFTGSGNDPDGNLPLSYWWQFGAGSGVPDSTLQDPGAVQFNNPGTYQVTLRVTDSLGLADPTPASRSITVRSNSPVIPQTGWRLHYVDSQELVGGNWAGTNAFDGNVKTFWHTQFRNGVPRHPHEIQIDLGRTYTLEGFRYLPRQDGYTFGTIGKYQFYVSADGANWGSPVVIGTLANNLLEKEVSFGSKTGQFIRLLALSEVNGNLVTSMAEINVLGTLSGNQAPEGVIQSPSGDVTIPVGGTVSFTGSGNDPDGNLPLSYWWQFGAGSGVPDSTLQDPGAVQFNNPGTYQVTLRVTDSLGLADPTPASRSITVGSSSPVIPQTGWRLHYVDSQELVGGNWAGTNAFDGNVKTFWHTQFRNGVPRHPHEIQIDLGRTYTLEGFRYLPRQDGIIFGTIGQYAFYVSVDGMNWGIPVVTGTWANNASEKAVSFLPQVGQYIRLVALSEVTGRYVTSMAELNVLGY